ncbi:MAG TPA: hypothetical protein VI756_07685, partial [Blastocatellia bacterium]
LMKKWLASPVRKDFYASPSFDEFSQSHLYIKIQNRMADFNKALGFSIDEDRLAELAGGTTAISLYDIGKLEMVFVSEMPRLKAVQTTVFKAAPHFEQKTASGTSYYVHEVTTDGGRLDQQFCFAYAGGRLIVTTTEGLMVRTLAASSASGADSLLSDILATSQQASGFSAHDLTLWLDQAKLSQNRHFINYWIYHNTAEQDADSIAGIQNGLIDLAFAADGMHERRWFTLKTTEASQAPPRPLSAEEATSISRFAPAGTQMIQVNGSPQSNEHLGEAVSQILFGKLPDDAATAAGTPPSDDSGQSSHNSGRTDRYSQLDQRFDMDVDDDTLIQAGNTGSPTDNTPKGQSPAASSADPAKRFGKKVTPILAAISPAGYCEMVRSRLEKGKPFVTFERAIVLQMGSDSGLDRGLLERTISDEFRSRFVIAGISPKVDWQDDASVRYLAQSLLEQGASYSVSGKYLILTSSKEFARDILAAGTGAPSSGPVATKPASAGSATPAITAPVELYAVLKIGDAKPVFDALTAKLDRHDNQSAASGTPDSDQDQSQEDQTTSDQSQTDEKKPVKVFSDNISSLIKASAIREITLQRRTNGATMSEQVNYLY